MLLVDVCGVNIYSGFEVDSFYCFYGYDFFLLDECWALFVEWGVIGLYVRVVLTL